jgi:hypothetical protein
VEEDVHRSSVVSEVMLRESATGAHIVGCHAVQGLSTLNVMAVVYRRLLGWHTILLLCDLRLTTLVMKILHRRRRARGMLHMVVMVSRETDVGRR